MENDSLNLEEFTLLYPDKDPQELLSNEDFTLFAEGKLDKEPLASVYKKYTSLTERIIGREKEKFADILANKLSAVGSLANANPGEDVFFTREQVKNMSRAEISKNYEKIRKSQEKWR